VEGGFAGCLRNASELAQVLVGAVVCEMHLGKRLEEAQVLVGAVVREVRLGKSQVPGIGKGPCQMRWLKVNAPGGALGYITYVKAISKGWVVPLCFHRNLDVCIPGVELRHDWRQCTPEVCASGAYVARCNDINGMVYVARCNDIRCVCCQMQRHQWNQRHVDA